MSYRLTFSRLLQLRRLYDREGAQLTLTSTDAMLINFTRPEFLSSVTCVNFSIGPITTRYQQSLKIILK